LALCERLRVDYQPRFDALDGGVNPWANGTHVGVEIIFGSRQRRPWTVSARYGRRRLLLGRIAEYRSIRDAESDVRAELDELLKSDPASAQD
jgi:hypothetical protein